MPDRPDWTEVVGVLLGCAALLVLLVRLDAAGADREAARAREVLSERAEAARRDPPQHGEVVRHNLAMKDLTPVLSVGSSQPRRVETGPPSALLALFGVCGVMMLLAGAAILGRSPR